MSRYYRNAVTVEWLSNEPWGQEAENLTTVNYAITEGHSIGYITRTVANEELTRNQAIDLDIRYGGDGTFIVGEEEDEEDDEKENRHEPREQPGQASR